MADDIVTRLREHAQNCDCTNAEFDMDDAANEIERWRNIANRLGTHIGEGLYTDDWECREYAIAAYADWERKPDAHLYKYDVDPQPVWYFKNGEQV
jgi:hypothetical protein